MSSVRICGRLLISAGAFMFGFGLGAMIYHKLVNIEIEEVSDGETKKIIVGPLKMVFKRS